MPAPEGNNYAEGNDGGRPAKYDPSFAKQAQKLCALGATDIELADFFEINVRTLYRWRSEHEEFCQAVVAGKDGADDRVERAFYNRAVGYTFESEKVFQHQGQIVRAPTQEHVPPDSGAALNWLKNRRPDRWRDKQVVEHEGSMELNADAALAELLTELRSVSASRRSGGAS